jgi:hypothetical protein
MPLLKKKGVVYYGYTEFGATNKGLDLIIMPICYLTTNHLTMLLVKTA